MATTEEIVRRCLDELQRECPDRKVEIVVGQLRPCTADRGLLKQAWMNLLSNAVKYSPCNQPILIKLAQTQDRTTIQVQDYGCGISPEQQSRIFDRFYRVDDARSRATGGTGLGLAIVKTLVESIKGEITVWSEPGAGSLFTITLPSQLKG